MGTRKHHDVKICACGLQAFTMPRRPYTIMVSAEDRGLLDTFWWSINARETVVYAHSPFAMKTTGIGFYLHQHVFLAGKGKQTDHHDGNGLNCMRPNLREANKSQNQMNQRTRKTAKKSSKLKGVKFYTVKGIPKPFSARIHVNGKTEHLGSFATELEAATAYDVAAIKYFGDFARVNFP